jgi:hypothetical protein
LGHSRLCNEVGCSEYIETRDIKGGALTHTQTKTEITNY